jgi:hypothetical protein
MEVARCSHGVATTNMTLSRSKGPIFHAAAFFALLMVIAYGWKVTRTSFGPGTVQRYMQLCTNGMARIPARRLAMMGKGEGHRCS